MTGSEAIQLIQRVGAAHLCAVCDQPVTLVQGRRVDTWTAEGHRCTPRPADQIPPRRSEER